MDGFRGLALVVVLVFHSRLDLPQDRAPHILEKVYAELARLGWWGVDAFFVLSGFLITGILIDTRPSAGYFRNFYARRALRIFPLFYCMLVAVFILSWPLLVGTQYEAQLEWLKDRQVYFWLYLQNWPFALESPSPWNMLGHFWSLAIEEQFYILWPLVVFATTEARLKSLCWLLMITALAVRVLAWGSLPGVVAHDMSYFATVSRMDGLAAGSLLAIWAKEPGGLARLRPYAATVVLGGFTIFFGAWLYQRQGNGPGAMDTLGMSALVTLFSAFLVWVATSRGDTRVVQFLSSPLMRTLGKYSYAMYVFHYPLIFFLKHSLGLTRFRGHLRKGGYDAKYGQANRCETDAPAVS